MYIINTSRILEVIMETDFVSTSGNLFDLGDTRSEKLGVVEGVISRDYIVQIISTLLPNENVKDFRTNDVGDGDYLVMFFINDELYHLYINMNDNYEEISIKISDCLNKNPDDFFYFDEDIHHIGDIFKELNIENSEKNRLIIKDLFKINQDEEFLVNSFIRNLFKLSEK